METYSLIQEVRAQIFTRLLNDLLKILCTVTGFILLKATCSLKDTLVIFKHSVHLLTVLIMHSFIQWMYTNNEDEQNMIEGATLGVFILWTSWYLP